MSLKKAAEELLKLADDIEREALEVTQFTCGTCNHTATLATINASRKKSAEEMGDNVVVSNITVNDKIACPACEGVMAYNPTEASTAYYFDEKKASDDGDADDVGKDTPEAPEEEEEAPAKKKASEPVDYDQLDRYLKG